MSPDTFNLEELHKPLRDCYEDEFSHNEWQVEHGNVFENRPENIADTIAEWTLFDIPFSLLKAVYEHENENQPEDFEYWREDTIEKNLKNIGESSFLESLFNNDDQALFKSGKITGTLVEFLSISKVLQIHLKVIEIDKECNILQEHGWVETHEKKVQIVWFEEIFGIAR